MNKQRRQLNSSEVISHNLNQQLEPPVMDQEAQEFLNNGLTESVPVKQYKISVSIYDNQEEQGSSTILFKDIEVNVDYQNQIMGKLLIEDLKKKGYSFQNKLLSYYDIQLQLYIYMGNYEEQKENQFLIPFYQEQDLIALKVRRIKQNIVDRIKQEFKNEQTKDSSSNSKTLKEKKIKEVIDKVALWRRLYSGFFDDQGNFIQLSLEQAAKQVDISKKTLDDYLLQIRQGKKYGFDFNKHLNENIGKLRSFVKENKTKPEKEKKIKSE